MPKKGSPTMLTRLVNFREERESGFTLVELLVVIIIIGILAAIAIPVFLNQRQRANDAAVQSAVKSYVTALESHLVAQPNDNSLTTAKAEAEGARASTGVTVGVTGGTNGYTVCATHVNGKSYKQTAPTTGATPATAGSAYVFKSVDGVYTAATVTAFTNCAGA